MTRFEEYERPAVTGDTVVIRDVAGRREVLLIRRGHEPFAGMWALPGGFLDPYEAPQDGARRELTEETGLAWDGPLACIGGFGKRGRDPRGWTVSVVYLAVLDDPDVAVAGGDDAAEAAWHPLDDPPQLAFDHGEILDAAREMLAGG
ncbi:MAG: NUDIX hydrolase [Actinobacteria bacterium]|nr:MAG: NUDIX hydrolase [Actinomycetota bacterium]